MLLANPIKFILNFFKFLYNDLKSDWETVKGVIHAAKTGEKYIDDEKMEKLKQEIKKISILGIIKEYWLFFLIAILIGALSWTFASKYYQIQCNNLIYETYVKPTIVNITYGAEAVKV